MATPADTFPSLIIRADGYEAYGDFAQRQAAFLEPDPTTVADLTSLLKQQQVGVVAHFYMDAELQGALSASEWPHIHTSDSLVMAGRAVDMAAAGMKTIVVLGVDFMSENVRAMLDAAGYEHVPVYRVATDPIGCTLAEAAQSPAYDEYLTEAQQTGRALHVIYINTSLLTKARAQHRVPTITCTSSNVVRTVLQAASQIPDLHVFYGPDAYMGGNLTRLFTDLAGMDEAAVAALHPDHNPKTVNELLGRYRFFERGVCVVHEMFGQHVAETLEEQYADDFITAHLEVPGEMFSLALAAQRRGTGVVGSTSNILSFIMDKTQQSLAGQGQPKPLRFILGTETGMITPIARQVRATLNEHAGAGGVEQEVQIIFPVAGEAVARTDDRELPIVPGAAGAEGCPAGGCASCVYMKMNSLTALLALLRRIGVDSPDTLAAYCPHKYTETIEGRSAADLGSEPIIHMREFQRLGKLPETLVKDILGRGGRTSA